MTIPNQKSECCIECWQKAWTSTKGNFMHCCYPECKCHSPIVATSEKECTCPSGKGKDCYFPSGDSEKACWCKKCHFPTPNESEDWSEKISKYQNECLKHFESYRGNVPAEKDFTHSLTMFKDAVRNEAYQRGREEGEKKELEKYSELIFAVGNKYQGETRHETALRYIKQAEQGSGEEQAKSIISGLMKK